MLVQQLRIPSNVAIVEVRCPHVQHHIEQHGEIENGKIDSVTLRPHTVLHPHVHAKHPERLDKKVQKDEQTEVENEILLSQNNVQFTMYNLQ